MNLAPMYKIAERMIDRATRALPPSLAARVDLLRPSLAKGFGPFNGQQRRQEVVAEILRSTAFDLVIETGTFRGTTTERLREMTTASILTIELSRRFYQYSRRRLSRLRAVRVEYGDSAAQIRHAASEPTHDRSHVVFAYLDAHWGESLPTRYELLELITGWDSVCAVIDDFKVPGDPGYAYDDYGPGFVVDESLFDGLPLAAAALFYPSMPSSTETGHRRGWAVVVWGDGLLQQIEHASGLVLAGPLNELGGTG